jgi:hypothetical protein
MPYQYYFLGIILDSDNLRLIFLIRSIIIRPKTYPPLLFIYFIM